MTAAAVALLTGCAAAPPVPRWVDPETSSPAPAMSDAAAASLPEPSAPAGTTALAASGERFVAEVRGRLSGATLDLRNEEITEMGGQACASLAAGRPRRAVAEELAGYGLPEAAARELVILARNTLCEAEAEAEAEAGSGNGNGGGAPAGDGRRG